jgi:hypothetical protein
MRSGLFILTIFAAAWACAGLMAAGYAPAWTLAPAAVSAALLGWTLSEPATARSLGPHVRRLVGRWSMIEGLAIGAALYVLVNRHEIEAIFPVLAVIVGIHFLPLARGIPIRLYYASGTGLVLLGLGGMLVPAADRPIAIGLGAAAILWATAFACIRRMRRKARAPDPRGQPVRG